MHSIVLRRQLPNFIPVIDGEFVPINPKDLWRQGAAADKDFITGCAADDSAAFVMPNINGR